MLRYLIAGMIAAGILAAVFILGSALMPPAGDLQRLARGEVAAFEFLDRPEPAPETRFVNAGGEEVTLADYRGKVLLVNLWATWCAPCKEEMPTLDALQAEMGGEDFKVIAISMDRDGPAAARKFLEQQNLKNLDLYTDQTGRMVGRFAVRGLPFTLLVDRESRVVGRMIGPAEWDAPEARALVRKVIEG